jgi:hypothetical protein
MRRKPQRAAGFLIMYIFHSESGYPNWDSRFAFCPKFAYLHKATASSVLVARKRPRP